MDQEIQPIRTEDIPTYMANRAIVQVGRYRSTMPTFLVSPLCRIVVAHVQHEAHRAPLVVLLPSGWRYPFGKSCIMFSGRVITGTRRWCWCVVAICTLLRVPPPSIDTRKSCGRLVGQSVMQVRVYRRDGAIAIIPFLPFPSPFQV
jgi:hypothetical protein